MLRYVKVLCNLKVMIQTQVSIWCYTKKSVIQLINRVVTWTFFITSYNLNLFSCLTFNFQFWHEHKFHIFKVAMISQANHQGFSQDQHSSWAQGYCSLASGSWTSVHHNRTQRLAVFQPVLLMIVLLAITATSVCHQSIHERGYSSLIHSL